MRVGWLRRKISFKEKQILKARIKLAKLQAERSVYINTLSIEPEMGSEFEYEFAE